MDMRQNIMTLREIHSLLVCEEPDGTWNVWLVVEPAAEHPTMELAEQDADELAPELSEEADDA